MDINQKYKVVDMLGVLSIGCICLGYIFGSSTFAELSIQFSFLNFPIFIGEVLTLFCLGLLFIKSELKVRNLKRWQYVLAAYICFVLAKTFLGYCIWGPLALRHAALFYYPIFVVFGFSFFKREYFKEEIKYFISALIMGLFVYGEIFHYINFTLVIVGVVTTFSIRNKVLRYVLLSIFLFLTPYEKLFHTSRMMIVANLTSMAFLIVFLMPSLRIKKRIRFVVIVLSMFLVVLGVREFPNKAAFKSIISFNKMQEAFNFYDERVQLEKNRYQFVKLNESAVYNPNTKKRTKNQRKSGEEGSSSIKPVDEKEEYVKRFHGDVNNAVFRLFIWRDMLERMTEKKSLLGFDFGEPLRSISLEILKWGSGEWTRDGWIAAHNSYLHIMYRTGIVGILFIIVCLGLLGKMVFGFIVFKSVKGILLSSTLIGWMVAANFLLIFELPYSAIPIWTLYGVVLAYYHSLIGENKLKDEGNG